MDNIKEGDRVLYLWEGEIDSSLERNVESLKNRTNVTVNVENVQRLSLGMCAVCVCVCGLEHTNIFFSHYLLKTH